MQKLYAPTRGPQQPATPGSRTLTFGTEILDKPLGELKQGELIAFHGSPIRYILSELLCVRSQLPQGIGGLDSSVIFMDPSPQSHLEDFMEA